MFGFNFWKKHTHVDWLIVGLGNVGAAYTANRHNVGFMLVDALAEETPALNWQKKFHGQVAHITYGGQKVALLKPATMMNLSGRAVQAALTFYKLPLERLIVAHDELDIPFGAVRSKQGGGDAGHNGLKDITRALGKNYWRIRLGIDHPGDKNKVSGYVLSDFSKAEQQDLPALLKEGAAAIEKIIA